MSFSIWTPRRRSAILWLSLLASLATSSCAREPERQWYKIGQPYTLDEFRRDTAQCTKAKKLDFDCMRERGWVDVSADRPETSSEKGGTQILPLPAKSY